MNNVWNCRIFNKTLISCKIQSVKKLLKRTRTKRHILYPTHRKRYFPSIHHSFKKGTSSNYMYFIPFLIKVTQHGHCRLGILYLVNENQHIFGIKPHLFTYIDIGNEPVDVVSNFKQIPIFLFFQIEINKNIVFFCKAFNKCGFSNLTRATQYQRFSIVAFTPVMQKIQCLSLYFFRMHNIK